MDRVLCLLNKLCFLCLCLVSFTLNFVVWILLFCCGYGCIVYGHDAYFEGPHAHVEILDFDVHKGVNTGLVVFFVPLDMEGGVHANHLAS